MRTSYHEELDAIIDNLVHMAELVETAIKEGSESLLTADLARAEAVITNDAELDRIHEEMEYKCLSLLALQAPVAGELRTIVSAIRVVFELARMGDLAAHVANLVQNAISYSDERARVTISLALDGDVAEVKVSDNGIGIRPEDQDRIFERFFRVDYGRSRESGGTGLGLSIVRHIAVSHGGDIRVWSRPGQGSTFTLSLPAYLGAPDDDPEDEE